MPTAKVSRLYRAFSRCGMKKEEISLNMRVSVPGMGTGTVVNLMPETKFYVKVDFESGRYSGQEANANVENMRAMPPPKPTRQEKYKAKYEFIRSNPESYYIAGLAAMGPSKLHVSTPPKSVQKTQDELMSHGLEIGEGYSEATDRTMGTSYTLVMPNHGVADYESKTGVHSAPYFGGGADYITISAKQFVIDFLVGDLKFKLGDRQNVDVVRENVPQQFRAEFERGVEAATAESLLQ